MKTKKALVISVLAITSIAIVLIIRSALNGFTPKISPDSSKEECLSLARLSLERGEPESAIYPLLLAIEADQADFEPHYLLARVYQQTEVFHLAEEECKISLHLNPESKEALGLLCELKYERGKSSWKWEDLDRAISEFNFVVENSEDAKLLDSIAHLTGGRFKKVRLTNDLFFDDAPAFSPDGKRVVYHSDSSYFLEDYGLDKVEGKISRIFIMDADGKNKTCVSSREENQTSQRFARFSHDGRYIVYEKENSSPQGGDTIFNSNRDIYLQDLKSGDVRRLTEDDTYDGLPNLSSDDKRIVFVSDRTGGSSRIHIMELESREIRSVSLKKSWDEKIGLLRHARGPVLLYCPSFSPDGDRILFHAGWDKRGVFLLSVADGRYKCLTDRRRDCFFPSFSPDGKRVVFVSGSSEAEDLWLVNTDGSKPIRLTRDGGTKRYPSFSPDGNSVIFAGKRKGEPDNYFEIYLLQLDQTISREELKKRLEGLMEVVSN
jgi:Tol biopolymer transport system component